MGRKSSEPARTRGRFQVDTDVMAGVAVDFAAAELSRHKLHFFHRFSSSIVSNTGIVTFCGIQLAHFHDTGAGVTL
jgi:hypothetical protein